MLANAVGRIALGQPGECAVDQADVTHAIDQTHPFRNGVNDLTLDLRDLLDLSTTSHTLAVVGDTTAMAEDGVVSTGQGWSADGTVDGAGLDLGITFNKYTIAGSAAVLLVEQGLDQAMIG